MRHLQDEGVVHRDLGNNNIAKTHTQLPVTFYFPQIWMPKSVIVSPLTMFG